MEDAAKYPYKFTKIWNKKNWGLLYDYNDVWCHMASLGHNELTHSGLVAPYGVIDLVKYWIR